MVNMYMFMNTKIENKTGGKERKRNREFLAKIKGILYRKKKEEEKNIMKIV